MKSVLINVKGMVCNGCENRIKNALSQLDGVESVKANHETGEVTIEASIDQTILEEKLEELGFEVEK